MPVPEPPLAIVAFSDTVQCPKCLFMMTPTMKHDRQYCDGSRCEEPAPKGYDHLHYRCLSCQHRWLMWCADYVQPTVQ